MVGELIAERFELEELVGVGGMSSVYRARDLLLERPVALKILHESAGADEASLERFRREARAAAQLSHPNIVTVIDRGEDRGRQFIVFELIDGEDLKELVDREGRLPVRRALELAIEIGRGLSFAHAHGVVHRDVKPQNVLLNGDGRAKVTDFGIARSTDLVAVTLTGTVLGTSNYVSPEQASGIDVDARTDVYSLGCVLYELLTGTVPFAGDSFVAVALQHVHDPPPSVLDQRPEVPLRVARAVEQAMEKDPDDRFDSMDELVAELEACLRELGSRPAEDATAIMTATPRLASSTEPAEERPRRVRRWLLLEVAALVLGAVVALGVLAGRDFIWGDGATGGPVRVAGIGAFDPYARDGEHDGEALLATDRDAATYWPTETYSTFSKPGVGLVLDAGSRTDLAKLTVSTSTPGFTAEVKAGNARFGPFARVASSRQVEGRTTFSIHGPAARYYVVWITKLPRGVARITEVTARS